MSICISYLDCGISVVHLDLQLRHSHSNPLAIASVLLLAFLNIEMNEHYYP